MSVESRLISTPTVRKWTALTVGTMRVWDIRNLSRQISKRQTHSETGKKEDTINLHVTKVHGVFLCVFQIRSLLGVRVKAWFFYCVGLNLV